MPPSRRAAREPPQRVGRATIELMAETLQWPEPDKHPWETCSITCDASEAAGRAAPVDSGFWAQLSHALARPVAAEATTGAEAEARASLSAADAAQTAENVVHQLDNRLRRLVSGHMKSAEVVALPPAQVSAIAKSLSDRKREALAACKRQLRRLPLGARVAPADETDEDRLLAEAEAIEQQFVLILAGRAAELPSRRAGARDSSDCARRKGGDARAAALPPMPTTEAAVATEAPMAAMKVATARPVFVSRRRRRPRPLRGAIPRVPRARAAPEQPAAALAGGAM